MRSPEKRVPNFIDANIRHEKEDEGGLFLLTRILEFFSSSHFLLSLEQNPFHVKKNPCCKTNNSWGSSYW